MVIPSCERQQGCRHRLSRERAGGDPARQLSQRQGRSRSAEVTQQRARDRRAWQRRRTGARASRLRLGQVYACAADRTRDCPGASTAYRSRTICSTRSLLSGPRLGALAGCSEDIPARWATRRNRATCWCRTISRATLEAIARDGAQRFYEGPVAQKIVAAVKDAGGVMEVADLRNYVAKQIAPLRGTYRGYDIVSMPSPSSGGTHLIEMLNILEGFPLGDEKSGLGFGSPQALHLMIETMKIAYADRAEFLGDTGIVSIPVNRLISKEYADKVRPEIDPKRARSAKEVRPNSAATAGGNTTHYSIVDKDGNAVANTYSLNFNYGLGFVAEGTGVLLNNTLDDFAAKPGAPNAFGLVGGDANAPASASGRCPR